MRRWAHAWCTLAYG